MRSAGGGRPRPGQRCPAGNPVSRSSRRLGAADTDPPRGGTRAAATLGDGQPFGVALLSELGPLGQLHLTVLRACRPRCRPPRPAAQPAQARSRRAAAAPPAPLNRSCTLSSGPPVREVIALVAPRRAAHALHSRWRALLPQGVASITRPQRGANKHRGSAGARRLDQYANSYIHEDLDADAHTLRPPTPLATDASTCGSTATNTNTPQLTDPVEIPSALDVGETDQAMASPP